MTDDRAALHARLSVALEATLGADAVWTEVRCPRCGYTQALPFGRGCPRCIEPVVEASMPRRPIKLEDETDAEARERFIWENTLQRQVDALSDAVRVFPDWHPEWRLTACAPVDWDDPSVLWPRWERWVSLWIHAADSEGTRMQRITDTRVAMRTAIDTWWEMEEPTITAALATTWDALLTKEAVRYGG